MQQVAVTGGGSRAAEWAGLRQARTPRSDPAFHGEAGPWTLPRVSVSRSIFALMTDEDRMYFGRGGKEADQVGQIDNMRAITLADGQLSE